MAARASRFAIFVLMSAACASARATPLEPVYSWLMDDGAGTTVAAAHGEQDGQIISQSGTWAWSSDTPFDYVDNSALHLNTSGGSENYVEVSALNGATDGWAGLTLSAWVKSDEMPSDRSFFGGVDPSNEDLFGIRYDQQGWRGPGVNAIKAALTIDGVSYQYESGSGHQTTEWQHIVMTWQSGEGFKLYVNGQLDAPTYVDAGFDTIEGGLSGQTRFLIGAGAKDVWQGLIDEVAVWDEALSAEDVAWLSENSLDGLGGPQPAPEPATLALLVLGALGLAIRRRRA